MVESCLIYCVEPSPESIANAAFLLGSYLVLNCGMEPQKAAKPFMASEINLRPFRDTTYNEAMHTITLPDCLTALARAHSLRWCRAPLTRAHTTCSQTPPMVATCIASARSSSPSRARSQLALHCAFRARWRTRQERKWRRCDGWAWGAWCG